MSVCNVITILQIYIYIYRHIYIGIVYAIIHRYTYASCIINCNSNTTNTHSILGMSVGRVRNRVFMHTSARTYFKGFYNYTRQGRIIA